jgi:hypothetical protein
MANVSRPNGATPVSTISGNAWGNSVRRYYVDSSNATAIFKGDFITLEDDGNVTPAAAGGLILGVCTGIDVDRAVAATEHPGYLPASTAGYISVCVGPDTIYEIQEDGVGGAMVATNVGSNGDMVAGTGSTTTGRSGHLLDSSDVIAKDASAASAQLLVLGLAPRVDNEIGTSAKWLVRINESAFAYGAVGL